MSITPSQKIGVDGDVGDEQQHVDTRLEPIEQRPEGAMYWLPRSEFNNAGWYKNDDGWWFWPLKPVGELQSWKIAGNPNLAGTAHRLQPLTTGDKKNQGNQCTDCGEALRPDERVQCDHCAGVEDLFVYDVQQRIDNKDLTGVDDTDVVESEHIADTSKMVGQKFDSDKPRFDLIPPLAEQRLAEVLTFGAKKYAPGNWQQVPDAENRYIADALRHINAQRIGEHSDPETGLPHLSHAMCCLAFVIELQEREFAEVEIRAALDAEADGTAPASARKSKEHSQ